MKEGRLGFVSDNRLPTPTIRASEAPISSRALPRQGWGPVPLTFILMPSGVPENCLSSQPGSLCLLLYSTPGVTETEKSGKGRAHTQVCPDEFGPSQSRQTLTVSDPPLPQDCRSMQYLPQGFSKVRWRPPLCSALSLPSLSSPLWKCPLLKHPTLPGSLPRLHPVCRARDRLHFFSNNKLLSAGRGACACYACGGQRTALGSHFSPGAFI